MGLRHKETSRQGDKEKSAWLLVSLSPNLLVFILALALRLLVWRWHEQYPLGGDEREYFGQALALLRTHHYEDLPLMRPPLYTFVLAGWIYLFDSLIQRLRLIQAVIGALTVIPVFLLTRRLFGRRDVALVAGVLAALSYTLAANATELLTETLFLFGLSTLFWLLVAAGDRRPTTDDQEPKSHDRDAQPRFYVLRSPLYLPALAGLCVGALALLRSVALPLIPLGALWLLARPYGRSIERPYNDRRPATDDGRPTTEDRRFQPRFSVRRPTFDALRSTLSAPLVYILAALLVIAPWTARNYLAYRALILVDTTGAENLWLDNNPAGATPADPLGREDAKRQLYALGSDRGARQRLALARGQAAIRGEPGWFLSKAWGEAKKFFALQYFDDMRERRAIWVPPAEVWLRLLLGDGLWLALLLCGAAGLWLAPAGDRRPMTADGGRLTTDHSEVGRRWVVVGDPRWLVAPWALYTLLTAMLFHVELRYRLPLYPVLLPYAAWAICQAANVISAGSNILATKRNTVRYQAGEDFHHEDTKARTREKELSKRFVPASLRGKTGIPALPNRMKPWLAGLMVVALLGITLLHRPYPAETWMLARKHYQLWQSERALAASDLPDSAAAASAAIGLDQESALARVALARADLAAGDRQAALGALDQAVAVLPAHPYAHLLRGALRREQGDLAGAREDLGFEKASLEDLQAWAWRSFAPFAPAPAALDVGGGLDLGFVQGFSLPEQSFRWSSAEARVVLAASGAPNARLRMRLAGGRPPGAPQAVVTVLLGGRAIGQLAPASAWGTYELPVPADLRSGPVVVTLRGDTFRPRDFDRASPDARWLGVMVGRVEIVTP